MSNRGKELSIELRKSLPPKTRKHRDLRNSAKGTAERRSCSPLVKAKTTHARKHTPTEILKNVENRCHRNFRDKPSRRAARCQQLGSRHRSAVFQDAGRKDKQKRKRERKHYPLLPCSTAQHDQNGFPWRRSSSGNKVDA